MTAGSPTKEFEQERAKM
jgi:hypothetical protein